MSAPPAVGSVPLLDVRDLSKRFGGLQAVRNLSFALREGEIVSLIGPNGAGKTTVFGLLSGFHPPDGGEIRLRGRSLVGLKPHAICALGLARTFQIVRPFPHLSAMANVEVGALAREARRPAAPTPGPCSRRGGSAPRPISRRAASPSPSASGWSSPGPSPPGPRSFSSMR